MPDTENPAKDTEPAASAYTAVELSDDSYHQLADVYMEDILSKFEALQDVREGLDVEYSVRSPPLLPQNTPQLSSLVLTCPW